MSIFFLFFLFFYFLFLESRDFLQLSFQSRGLEDSEARGCLTYIHNKKNVWTGSYEHMAILS